MSIRPRGTSYRRLHVLLRQGGKRVNHQRVWRVYQEAGLCVKRKKRKRLVRAGRPATVLSAAHQEWALDFVHAVLGTGQQVRVLSVQVLTRGNAWRWKWTRASPVIGRRGCWNG